MRQNCSESHRCNVSRSITDHAMQWIDNYVQAERVLDFQPSIWSNVCAMGRGLRNRCRRILGQSVRHDCMPILSVLGTSHSLENQSHSAVDRTAFRLAINTLTRSTFDIRIVGAMRGYCSATSVSNRCFEVICGALLIKCSIQHISDDQ